MRLLDGFQITKWLLQKELEANPEKRYKKSNGQVFYLKDVLVMFNKLVSWVYPDLTDEDIVRVIRCKRCIHHKKINGKMCCSITGKAKENAGYCDEGCEK